MADERLLKRSDLPFPPAEVFAWHERPGALERLNPPWEVARVEQRTGGLEVGVKVVLRPRLGPVPLPAMVAEHVAYEPPHLFRDVQRQGPFAKWEHSHRFEASAAGTTYVDDVSYRLPLGALGQAVAGRAVRHRLQRMFDYRHRQTVGDLNAQAALKGAPPMHVAVTGASGLLGSALLPFLTTAGHEVTSISRSAPSGPNQVQWDPAAGWLDPAALRDVDAVVHLAGENIASGRWNDERKRRILASREQGTALIARTLAGMGSDGPRTLICASAVGYYGDRGDEELTEDAPPGKGFLADVCRRWEAAADPAREAGVRVVHLRIGLVLTPEGGALQPMLPLFRLGLGGPLGSGRQYWPWVALDDICGMAAHALARPELSGPVNATAPTPLPNADFTKVLAGVLGRPAVVPVPAFAPRALLGEMADELIFSSQRVLPRRLLDDGYRFRFTELEPALRHMLGR